EDARYVLLLTRGILHFNQKNWAGAEADFAAAQALKPSQYNAYLNLAHVRLAQGQFGPAAELVDRALRLGPPALVLYGYQVERARALLRDANWVDAIAACDAALGICPDQSPPLALR